MLIDTAIVKASAWHSNHLTDKERINLFASGMVPVNDCFFPLWNDESKIKLLFGSFGSGKSDFVALWFIKECRKPQYFKEYYGRKVEADARDSCHSKLVTIIKRHNLQKEFKYSEEPTGTMVITHIKTGNKLLPFGASDTDGMKSVDDPTAIWFEEADQFVADDLRIMLTRLRTKRAKHHLWLSFNTAPILPGHWILKYFFPEMVHASERNKNDSIREALEAITCTKCFCNYNDNYFIDRVEYEKNLRFNSGGDEAYYNAIAKGAWGVGKEGLEFPITKLNFYDPAELEELIKENGADMIYMGADPANLGGDNFAIGVTKLVGDRIYLTDVRFNQNGANYNEREFIKLAMEVKAHWCGIEGVMGWRETVQRIKAGLDKLGFDGEVRCLKPRTNKIVRILARSSFIKRNIYFRRDYNADGEYAAFMANLTSSMSNGKNPTDDGADLVEMLAAFYEQNFSYIWSMESEHYA